MKFALSKTNVSLENRPSQKERIVSRLQTTIVQGQAASFREGSCVPFCMSVESKKGVQNDYKTMVANGAQVVLMARNDIASATSDRSLKRRVSVSREGPGPMVAIAALLAKQKTYCQLPCRYFPEKSRKVPLSLVGVTFCFLSC